MTIAAVGDLMLARDVTTLMQQHGPGYPFERVRDLFDGADLLIGNMEGTFTDRGEPLDKIYTFRTPPDLARGLAEAGFDAVNLANNHAYDFGRLGLADTLDALDRAGVRSFGAGLTEAEARAPLLLRANGLTVALLGFDTIPEVRFAEGETPGVALATPEAVTAGVEAAAARADFVVVSLHFGAEYTREPTERQRELARAAIDAGASLVIGHHPHVLQPWERYGGGVVFYSLGNFVFDLDADDLETLGPGPFETVVVLITLTPGEPPEVELRPAYIDVAENRPRPATPAEAAAVLEALRELR